MTGERHLPIAEALARARLLLITGKGGVGRTTLTAALARTAARRGRQVLVVHHGRRRQGAGTHGRVVQR